MGRGLVALEGEFREGHLTSRERRRHFFFYYLTAAYIQFPTPPPLLILTVHIGTAAISIFDCVRSRGLGLKLHSLHFMFVDEE